MKVPIHRGLLLLVLFFGLAALIVFLERPTGQVTGLVQNEQGQPIAGAKVTLDAYPVKLKANTDEQGRFQIDQVPVGKYYVQIHGRGFQRAYLKERTVTEGQVLHLGLHQLKPLPPRLYVALWNTVKIPGEKVALSLSGAKIQNIAFQAYRVDLLDYLQNGYVFRDLERDQSRPESLPGLTSVAKWEYTLPEKERLEFDFKLPLKANEHPWMEKPGLYLIHAVGTSVDRSKVFSSNTLLNRTDLGFLVKQDGKHLLVYASTLKDPKPATKAQVHGFVQGKPLLSATTDEQGLASLELPSLSQDQKSNLFVVVTSDAGLGYTYSYGSNYYGAANSENGEELTTFLYTDRPLYRPGQRVFWKGLVRRPNAQGTYDLPSAATAQVILEDPRGNLLQETQIEVGGASLLSGSFPLSEALGFYQIRATLHGQEFTHSFEVDEYRKPEFKLQVTPGQEHYYAGDKVTFLIDAQYFFGAPVEAEIEYTLYKSPYFYVPSSEGFSPDEWGYGYDEGYVGGYGEYLTDGKVSTNAQGHAKVEYSTAKAETDFRYTLRMRARDISDRQIEGEGSITVPAGEFFFRTQRSTFLAFPEKPYSLTVLAKNYQDQPVAVDYKIEIKREYWDGIAKKYRYKKVGKVQGKTNAQGRGVSEITVKQGGYYHLVIQGKDPQGRKVAFTDTLWAVGSAKDSEDYGIAKTIKVIPEKKRFDAGETAKFLLVGPKKDGKVLLSLEGRELYQAQIVTLDGYSKQIEIPLKKEWIPNLFIQATAIGKKAFYNGETELALSPKAYYLNITIAPEQEKYEPGQKIAYQITTQDEAGKPIAAEFSMGVVDEKIYALRADPTNIKQFFWGARPNQVGTNYSFSEYYSGGIQKEDRNLLRRNFKDTAYWAANLRTDEQGQARVSFKLPDNLTTWRATVLASTLSTAVGQETNQVLATKPLIARVAAPRFFTERDQVYLKALLHNYTESEQTLTVSLGLSGLEFVNSQDGQNRQITIPAKEVRSFDFPVLAKTPGKAKVQLLAKNDQFSDGVELAIPILPYGLADRSYTQGKITGALADSPGRAQVELVVPPKTNAERSHLKLTLDTSFIGQLMGSLAYLVQYPYGCVEQVTSRLLPAIMVAKASQALGVSDPQLEKKLPRVIQRGIQKIERMQNYQGGWGWWTSDDSNAFMTTYALFGLLRAQALGQKVTPAVLKQGKQALAKIIKTGVQPSRSYLFGTEGTRYFMNYVASLAGIAAQIPSQAGNQLKSPMAKALLALSLIQRNSLESAQNLLTQLEQSALCEQGQCHYQEKGAYQDRSVMATAWVLQALVQANVENAYLKDGLARWLLAQRKGGHWRHTLETAVALDALTQYAQTLPGTQAGVQVLLKLNGKKRKIQSNLPHQVRQWQGCTAGQADCPGKDQIPLQVGNNLLEMLNSQVDPLYYQTEFVSFSTDETLAPREQGIRIQREYVRLKRVRDPKTSSLTFKAELLGEIKKGDMIGVRVTLSSEEDLYYLMVEDPLPSGFEVTEGIRFDEKAVHVTEQTVRDEKITFFRTHLKAGTHVFNYALLPELAGDFYVLPTVAEEMYRPEVRGSSQSTKLSVTR